MFRALGVLGVVVVACGRMSNSTDGNTSWLRPCYGAGDCDQGFRCLCGACTLSCSAAIDCRTLGEHAVCIDNIGDACFGPMKPADGLCLRRCATNDDCAAGRTCLAGFCTPAPLG